MKKTFLGISSGFNRSFCVSLNAFWTGVSSKSMRMPRTGLGTISSPHSSVERSSVNENSSVLSPILVMKELSTSGLDSRGSQFYSCSPCISIKELLIK